MPTKKNGFKPSNQEPSQDFSGNAPVPFGSGEIVRREFLKIAGAGLVIPAMAFAYPQPPFPQNEDFKMDIKRAGSQASQKGPTDWFTGTVRIDPLFQANAPARAAGASVTFEPGRALLGILTRSARR